MPAPTTPAPSTESDRRDLATAERYLVVAYALAFPMGERPDPLGAPIFTVRLAEALGLSSPAAAEMLRHLASDGLLARAGRRWRFTEEGLALAEVRVRRQRIVAAYLHQVLGCGPAQAQREASGWAGSVGDEVIERMYRGASRPERDPFGWPIDTVVERDESPRLVRASTLSTGQRARVARIARHPRALVALLAEAGINPGAHLHMREGASFSGVVRLAIDDAEQIVPEAAAALAWVLPQPD